MTRGDLMAWEDRDRYVVGTASGPLFGSEVADIVGMDEEYYRARAIDNGAVENEIGELYFDDINDCLEFISEL